MAEKDKLSKEVEEQIQSLASDVYIQIEEKLTQLICNATPEESNEIIDVEKSQPYIALEQKHQASQNNFTVKVNELEASIEGLKTQLAEQQDQLKKNQTKEEVKLAEIQQKNDLLTEKSEHLTRENTSLKSSLAQEKTSLSNRQQDQKLELDNHTSELLHTIENLKKDSLYKTEQQQELRNTFNEKEQALIEHLDIAEKQKHNSEEKFRKAEEQWQKADELQTSTLVEQTRQTSELGNKLKAKNDDLVKLQEQYQRECSEQEKVLGEQQEKVTFLEDEIQQHVKASQEIKQELAQLNDQQIRLKEQQLEEQKKYSLKAEQQQQAQESSLQKINQLEMQNQELVNNLITEQSDIKLYQKEAESLKSQVKLAQEGQDNLLHRFNTNRDKQEKENDQVRETIKYLRDENSDMITQHNEKKEQFLEQIHELESKLTEYRLKFEYAQKQLTQHSEK